MLEGIRLAFSDYPFARRRRTLREGPFYTWGDIQLVARFLVYANAVVPFENVLHDADQMEPRSIRANDGKILAVATSSCGIRGAVKVVEWEDIVRGTWCRECFPDAAKVQRMVRGR